jgi:ABC-2 type transport system permease protein
VFGFLRCYVMLGVAAGSGGSVAGYQSSQLVSYVWVGQGLIATIGLWGDTELATRIRTGAVVSDLLRPMHPVATYLATDVGRAGFALLTRFVIPVIVGTLAFDFYAPRHAPTYPLAAVSIVLA